MKRKGKIDNEKDLARDHVARGRRQRWLEMVSIQARSASKWFLFAKPPNFLNHSLALRACIEVLKLPLALAGRFLLIVFCLGIGGCDPFQSDPSRDPFSGREEVIFWHFWGGEDGQVVDDIVRRFNESQEQYFVRAIAMPGNNLDTKLFLSIAGGDPPDLVNQDDPIVADWAYRGFIEPFDKFVDQDELASTNRALLPAARQLGQFEDKTFAIANGLDIRALIYNKTFLDDKNLAVPETIDEFETVIRAISSPGNNERELYAFLPDSRRLWSWSYVFGGQFLSSDSARVNITNEPTVGAAAWMQQFSRWYGADNVAAFRQGDQSLPGKTFPLLPVDEQQMVGRYVFIQAGQWNTRDVSEFQNERRSSNLPYPEFGVCPLPFPVDGRPNGGWVNGNVFVVPRGAANKRGAWEFIQFWIGTRDPGQAARTCAAGGWIPVTQKVIDQPEFQSFLEQRPLFESFVDLAVSPNQFTYPLVPGAPFFVRTVNATNESLIADPKLSPREQLKSAQQKIQTQLDAIREQYR